MTGDPRAATIARLLEEWFAGNQRELPWRASYDPWLVWVSETMLQQTRMSVVLPYFDSFIRRFPTVESLAQADEEEVLAQWSGLGYYRRARFLHAAARRVVHELDGRIPQDRESLMKLPGVGRYTAGAVAAIAFGEPVEAVDGNVERIASRLDAIEHVAGSAESKNAVAALARRVVEAASSPRVLNQALMEVGALICRPGSPDCGSCPVAGECRAHAAGEPEAYPKKAQQKKATRMRIPLLVIRDAAGRVLLLRGAGTLLNGMFHLPHGSSELDPGLLLTTRKAGIELGAFRHVITSRSIEFVLYATEPDDLDAPIGDGPEAMWVHPGELSRIPHPSYVRKALRRLTL